MIHAFIGGLIIATIYNGMALQHECSYAVHRLRAGSTGGNLS